MIDFGAMCWFWSVTSCQKLCQQLSPELPPSYTHNVPILCQYIAEELANACNETSLLVGLLDSRHAILTAQLDGGFPELRRCVWQSPASIQAAAQALGPQMAENKKKVCYMPMVCMRL